jgi:quercetin dioxygenase-like cupin family protein
MSNTCELHSASLDRPQETRRLGDAGAIELVTLAGVTIGRATFQPGFRWSRHARPVAGTDLCQATHTGVIVSGRQVVEMADGSRAELGPGDAFVIGPGHDAWVIGDEPCVSIDVSGRPDGAAR